MGTSALVGYLLLLFARTMKSHPRFVEFTYVQQTVVSTRKLYPLYIP